MLIFVRSVKMADRVMRKLMGLKKDEQIGNTN